MAGPQYKVALVGDAGVGKSTFFRRLKGTQEKNTVDCTCTKVYTFGNERVTFNISDTRGEEVHRSLAPTYYRRANVVICMYADKSPLSQIHLGEWIEKVNLAAKNPIIILIENTRSLHSEDVPKKPNEADFEAYCKHYGAKLFFQISADSEQQVEETFEQIARAVHTKDFAEIEKKCITDAQELIKEQISDCSIVLGNPKQPTNKSSCCTLRRRQQ